MEDTEKLEKVLIKLVAPLGSLGDEDDITVNDDIQREIVAMTVQLYGQPQPHDEQNDNVKQP